MATTYQQIYKNQTALVLRFDTGIDLSTASAAVIKYIKPDGTAGQFSAVLDSPTTDGTISYTVASSTDLDQSGYWKMWAYVTFGGTTYAPGSVEKVLVREEGT